MPPEFDCTREVILRASPDEVWDAIATQAGLAAWMFPNEIDPTGAGATAWDPPHHFAVRQQQGDWFNALECVIEARDGGTTLLRYAHSGVFVDDWDNQYDAVRQHTDFYLHTLSQYLEHFKGRVATYIGDVPQGIQGPPTSATPDGFERLRRALGLDEPISEGNPVQLTRPGAEPVSGIVDYLRPNFVGIRTPDELYCFFGRNAFGGPVGISIHSFADDVDAAATRQNWQRWLNTTLA
jgi:hypothetical protein